MKLTALKLTTFFVLTACFTVMTSALTVSQNLMNIVSYWGESLKMTVYLKEGVSPELIQAFEQKLKSDERIEKLEFISSETALDRFKDQMKIYAPELSNEKDILKSIPASLEFAISSRWSPIEQTQQMKNLADSLKTEPAVEEIHFGQEWTKAYVGFFRIVQSTGGIILSIILIGSFFIISNSIRASIDTKKNEIEILELIGATPSYIRTPFIKESIFLCTFAAGCSLLMGYLIFNFVQQSLASELSFSQLSGIVSFLNWKTAVGIMIFSTFIGWMASWICLRNLNNGWLASRSNRGEPFC